MIEEVFWCGRRIGGIHLPTGWTADAYDAADDTREGVRAEMILFGRDALQGAMRDGQNVDLGTCKAEKFLILTKAITATLLKSVGLTRRDERLETAISMSCLRYYGPVSVLA